MSTARDDYDHLPDDFFNDLADESFIEEVVDREDDDPQLNRCLEEIKVLERKIEKKRQVIKERQDGLTSEEILRQKNRDGIETRSRTRSRSRDRELRRHRSDRRRRSKSRSRSPRNRSPPLNSKHSRYEERLRDRDRRYVSPTRNRSMRRSRSRSKSPHRSKRSASTHRNISFLEELAQKFAEKGQAFPEKDALLGHNQMINNNVIGGNGPPISMEFGNVPFEPALQQPMLPIPNFQPQQVAYPLQQSMNLQYGMNPMSILAGNNVLPPATGNMAPVNIFIFHEICFFFV